MSSSRGDIIRYQRKGERDEQDGGEENRNGEQGVLCSIREDRRGRPRRKMRSPGLETTSCSLVSKSRWKIQGERQGREGGEGKVELEVDLSSLLSADPLALASPIAL